MKSIKRICTRGISIEVNVYSSTPQGAWWYSACHNSNLNGMYLEGPHDSFGTGVNWFHFRGYKYSLKFAEMKVRVKEEEAPPPSPPAGN